jgi:hypothetical protein
VTVLLTLRRGHICWVDRGRLLLRGRDHMEDPGYGQRQCMDCGRDSGERQGLGRTAMATELAVAALPQPATFHMSTSPARPAQIAASHKRLRDSMIKYSQPGASCRCPAKLVGALGSQHGQQVLAGRWTGRWAGRPLPCPLVKFTPARHTNLGAGACCAIPQAPLIARFPLSF